LNGRRVPVLLAGSLAGNPEVHGLSAF